MRALPLFVRVLAASAVLALAMPASADMTCVDVGFTPVTGNWSVRVCPTQ
jgi:hypothetical protein